MENQDLLSTEKKLKEETDIFFLKYIKPGIADILKWSEHWKFEGTIPYQENRGCYALFHNEEIIYIGVGIGNSSGIYKGCGLGDRLKRYYIKGDRNGEYIPKTDWSIGEDKITSILTIGFSEDNFYLAAALEVYLIKKIAPRKNNNII